MAELDELKERISYLKNFLTITIGVLVVTIGGLINFYVSAKIGIVFWLGVMLVVVLVFAALRVMAQIENHLKRLGEL